MPHDTGGRAKDRLQCCQGCGCELPPEPNRRGPRRRWCGECNPYRSIRTKSNATCQSCGKPAQQSPGKGRVRRYCSGQCKNAAKAASKKRHKRTCERCGCGFTGHAVQRFCSSRCRWPEQLSDPVCCSVCNKTFARSKRGQKCCSPQCRAAAKERHHAALGQRSAKRAKTHQCLCCSAPFRKRTTGRNAGKYCSRECAFEARRLRLPCATLNRRKGVSLENQLAVWFNSWGVDLEEPKNVGCRRGGHKHRCLQYGCHYEPVSDLSIFRRDNWTCQICGKELRRSKKAGDRWFMDPDYPTVDHIVPLSFGPSSPGHRPSNVQACCWQCNSRKGNSFAAQGATGAY